MPLAQPSPGPSTLADLEAMPRDGGRRYELVGGNIVDSAWPAHFGGISFRLGPVLARSVPSGHASYRLVGLDLPGEQRVIPDLVVAPHSSIGDQRLHLPVLLVVEITTGRPPEDRVAKRVVYAAAGVPAYWIIDPEATSVTCGRLDGDRYETYAHGAIVDVDWPLAVTVDVAALAQPSPPA